MKIHSKFHDYYDTALGYGIDPEYHFIRKTETYNRPDPRNITDHIWNKAFDVLPDIPQSYGPDRPTYGILVFCGKLYPMFSYDGDYGYTIEELDIIKNNTYGLWRTRKHYKQWFDRVNTAPTTRVIEFQQSIGTPYFYIDNEKITVHPQLTSLEFQRIMGPYEAFQELSMFISGVIGGNSPKIESLTDKDRISKHGFDEKSFRKGPTKGEQA